MKKRSFGVFVVLFLLVNQLVLADDGFWAGVGEWWAGFRGGNVAGKVK